MHIGYVPARETPIFSPEFPFRSISFSQITKIKSVPEHHHFTFFGGFCRSGDHHFQNFFNFNPFIGSHGLAAGQSASQTRPGSSGDSHFHAQNGSSLFRSPRIFKLKTAQARFRSPAFSCSTGSSFRSPGPFFTLPRHIIYPPKFWVSTPPPPPGTHIKIQSIKMNHNCS